MKPKRYLILPAESIRLTDATSAVSEMAVSLLAKLQPKFNGTKVKTLANHLAGTLSASMKHPAIAKAGSKILPSALEVIKSLGENSVKLVEATEEMAAALRQQNPGVRVVEETFCKPALAPRAQLPKRHAVKAAALGAKPAKKAGAASKVVVTVQRGDNGAPVKAAEVHAYRTTEDAQGKKTHAAGQATFQFGVNFNKFIKVYVFTEEAGVWSALVKNVKITAGKATITLPALNVSAEDSLRHFHGAGTLTDGAGVRVGVIDSGASADHPDLKDAIEGGANCVPQSNRAPGDFGPSGAHGTHVAGIIAARGAAPTGVRGVAPGAKLRIYRVFEDGSPGNGSSFALIDAIERAIADGCDIINLSLGFDPGISDIAVSDALKKARNHGILAVAAAGNDFRQPVAFPGNDSSCIGVSAAGHKELFPAEATESGEVAKPTGHDSKHFLAGFSNHGVDVDFTGSGVGVVSTVPGGHGPMSGTSMACPAVAGTAARLLANRPEILSMPRNAARADAIRKLVIDASTPLGFGILFEGAGLPV